MVTRRIDVRAPLAGALQSINPLWTEARSRVTGITRRVPVTPLGWLATGFALVTWIAGARLGWQELVTAGALVLCTVLLCGVLTLGRMSLRVAVGLSRSRVQVGAPAVCRVEVTNTARTRLLPIDLELPVGGLDRGFTVPSLAGGAVVRQEIPMPTHQRGVVVVGSATTYRGDPLGLLRRARTWTTRQELYVHPKLIGVDPLASGLLRDLDGYTTTDTSVSDLAFHTLREYVPGDDRRHIHWKSSAKAGSGIDEGRFQVRQFLDTRRTRLVVIVDGDHSGYTDPDQFEVALSIGASLAVRAITDDVDTTVFAGDQLVHDGTSQRTLDGFAKAGLGAGPMTALARRGRHLVPDATVAVLVTGPTSTFDQLHRTTTHFAPAVRKIAFRVDPGAQPSIGTNTDLTVCTVRALDDLPAAIRGGGR